MEQNIKSIGEIDLEIKYEDGQVEHRHMKNQVLLKGRADLAAALANQIGGPTFEFFVTAVQFGSGGTVGGTPRFVDDSRTGLFGPIVITKGVISTIPPLTPTQVTFTTVINFNEAVGNIINEMGLQLANGDIFSMATFGDISKTSGMQTTFNWSISFI